MRKFAKIFLAALFFFGLSTQVYASDEVVLKNGDVLSGLIFAQTQTELYLETNGGMKNFSLSEISSVNGEVLKVAESVPIAKKKRSIFQKAASTRQSLMKPLPSNVVSAAYRKIPHKQTTFLASKSSMKKSEAKVMQDMFSLVDRAVVARVETMTWMQTHGSSGMSYKAYDSEISQILLNLQNLEVPNEAKKPAKLIIEAIESQRKYFKRWNAAEIKGKRFDDRVGRQGWQNEANVKRANRDLIQAYNQLIRAYPKEPEKNKEAFFDHLCALDFI